MSEAVKAKKGGNFFKILIVILLVVILVGGAAFAGFFFASKNNTSTAAHSSETTTIVVSNVDEAFFAATTDKLINLADTDAKRYAKMTITLAYDVKNKKIATELTEKTNVIVDAIIGTIRNKKAADFDGKGAEDIKKELITRINSLLENGRITNIYYGDILIQ